MSCVIDAFDLNRALKHISSTRLDVCILGNTEGRLDPQFIALMLASGRAGAAPCKRKSWSWGRLSTLLRGDHAN